MYYKRAESLTQQREVQKGDASATASRIVETLLTQLAAYRSVPSTSTCPATPPVSKAVADGTTGDVAAITSNCIRQFVHGHDNEGGLRRLIKALRSDDPQGLAKAFQL